MPTTAKDLVESASACGWNGSTDLACAIDVAVFRGDINAVFVGQQSLLSCCVCRRATLTIAALGARGDVDPYRADHDGNTPILHAMRCNFVAAFLAAFPAFDVNLPCCGKGCTPLALISTWAPAWAQTTLQALLAAGAELTEDMWGSDGQPHSVVWETDPEVNTALVAWRVGGCRRAWVTACVTVSQTTTTQLAGPQASLPPVLTCVLADAVRMCIAPEPDMLLKQFQLASEFAGMVALYL